MLFKHNMSNSDKTMFSNVMFNTLRPANVDNSVNTKFVFAETDDVEFICWKTLSIIY